MELRSCQDLAWGLDLERFWRGDCSFLVCFDWIWRIFGVIYGVYFLIAFVLALCYIGVE